jgi:hypothetical protein
MGFDTPLAVGTSQGFGGGGGPVPLPRSCVCRFHGCEPVPHPGVSHRNRPERVDLEEVLSH